MYFIYETSLDTAPDNRSPRNWSLTQTMGFKTLWSNAKRNHLAKKAYPECVIRCLCCC